MEFIFFPDEDVVNSPKDYMGSYGYDEDDYDAFYDDVIANQGEEIVKIKKALTGYYDITLIGGTVLHAIDARSIVMKPVQ